MNGQPTAQNTRETGADGDLPGFRNWDNDDHVAQLAQIWNVDGIADPAHGAADARDGDLPLRRGGLDPLPVDQRHQPGGVAARARAHPADPRPRIACSSSCQDIFLTETAQLADVVLPAATWGEKTGTFTNADRTVHLSEKAVDPPGEARSDLDIFLDFARRMDFRDRDGRPLVFWRDSESAYRSWQRCSAGRPCDYTCITYDELRAGSESSGAERAYTRTASFRGHTPTTARPTAATCSPAARWNPPSTARSTPTARRCCAPPSTSAPRAAIREHIRCS